jgi:uncharacterized membrane protein
MQETQRPRGRGHVALHRPDTTPRAYWSRARVRSTHKTEQRARALGWLGIGLGVLEVLAYAGNARIPRIRRGYLLGVGLLEIATGVTILSRPRRARGLWGRVLADTLGFVELGHARGRGQPKWLPALTVVHTLATAIDAFTAVELSQRRHRGISIRAAITVNRPIEEVYRFWHNFENLPRFMANLESVEVHDGGSRWRAKGLPGATVVWEADVVVDRPNDVIVWRSHVDSELRNAGSVRFLPGPGGRGTEVRVSLDFDPRGGRIAEAIGKLFGKIPEVRVQQDLRRFKQVMETGEVVLSRQVGS